ncbi:hypothetical protein AB205_0209780 [Aquarana catesbeiana]|uniref:Uncharacterized protein n=1 Tax=Aquarana catesbeiana TaxID=8400 RepID=A0A2G9SJI9_AQUCT|nr:hypothetical protein AB205_0209780 [Aquarana catesbeiana]
MSSAWNSAKTDNCTPTSKQCFIFLFLDSNICVPREQRLGKYEDTRDTPPPHLLKKGNKGHNLRMWRKERWWRLSPQQVVVPKSSAFTSAQRMIQEIMFCSRDLDIIKEKTKEIEQRLKNIIDVLGRI